jgi:hypothetical protein
VTIIVRTRDGRPVAAHIVCCQDKADKLLAQPCKGETWTLVEVTGLEGQ